MDCPPGTGDIPNLLLGGGVHPSCAVVVTTPHKLSLMDTKSGVDKMRRDGVRVSHYEVFLYSHHQVTIGAIVENMAYLECPHCSGIIHPFGEADVHCALGLGEEVCASRCLHCTVRIHQGNRRRRRNAIHSS